MNTIEVTRIQHVQEEKRRRKRLPIMNGRIQPTRANKMRPTTTKRRRPTQTETMVGLPPSLFGVLTTSLCLTAKAISYDGA